MRDHTHAFGRRPKPAEVGPKSTKISRNCRRGVVGPVGAHQNRDAPAQQGGWGVGVGFWSCPVWVGPVPDGEPRKRKFLDGLAVTKPRLGLPRFLIGVRVTELGSFRSQSVYAIV